MVEVEIKKKKVMVVEDSDVIRNRIKGLLSGVKNISIVAEADCATDAIKFGTKHLPDVMILDIYLTCHLSKYLLCYLANLLNYKEC